MMTGFGMAVVNPILQTAPAGEVALGWVSWASSITGPGANVTVNSFELELTRSGKVRIILFDTKTTLMQLTPDQTGNPILWGPEVFNSALAGREYDIRMSLVEPGQPIDPLVFEVIGQVNAPAGATTNNENGTNP